MKQSLKKKTSWRGKHTHKLIERLDGVKIIQDMNTLKFSWIGLLLTAISTVKLERSLKMRLSSKFLGEQVDLEDPAGCPEGTPQ